MPSTEPNFPLLAMEFMEAGSLAMVTVYKNPSDYPDKFVARMFVIHAGSVVPTEHVLVKEHLHQIRGKLEPMVRMPRMAGDDPTIVETYT